MSNTNTSNSDRPAEQNVDSLIYVHVDRPAEPPAHHDAEFEMNPLMCIERIGDFSYDGEILELRKKGRRGRAIDITVTIKRKYLDRLTDEQRFAIALWVHEQLETAVAADPAWEERLFSWDGDEKEAVEAFFKARLSAARSWLLDPCIEGSLFYQGFRLQREIPQVAAAPVAGQGNEART